MKLYFCGGCGILTNQDEEVCLNCNNVHDETEKPFIVGEFTEEAGQKLLNAGMFEATGADDE